MTLPPVIFNYLFRSTGEPTSEIREAKFSSFENDSGKFKNRGCPGEDIPLIFYKIEVNSGSLCDKIKSR